MAAEYEVPKNITKYGIAQWIDMVFGFIITVHNQMIKSKSSFSRTNWIISWELVIAVAALFVYQGYLFSLNVIYTSYCVMYYIGVFFNIIVLQLCSVMYYIGVFFNMIVLFVGGLLNGLFLVTLAIGLTVSNIALLGASATSFDKEGNAQKKKSE